MDTVVAKRWPFWCWLPWIIVIIVILWCWWWPCPSADTFEANLIIEDETTAAWATTSNMFAGGNPASTIGTSFWTGILFHLGVCGGAELQFESIEFYSGGTLKRSFTRSEVAWINIVANRPGWDPPMTTDHYPLIDGSSGRIHAALEPTAVMTYWQGPEGLAMQAKQSTGSFDAINKQEFDFKDDDFSVTCYQTEFDEDGTLVAMPQIESFGVGEVDEIRVIPGSGGPGGGVKIDPPWTGP